jgi:hypothetical protein
LPQGLLLLLAEVLHVQVAGAFEPVLVHLDRQRPHQSQAALGVGEDAHNVGPALDLLVQALVWQDAAGDTWLSYNDLQWFAKRHGLGQQDAATVSAMSAALGALAKIVGGPP